MDGIKSIGIVLKEKLSKAEFFLLDRELGTIEVIPESRYIHRLCRGALITYNAQMYRGKYQIKSIDILHVPLELAQDDILFLHHLLEMCFFFIPSGIQHEAVFELLLKIYKMHYIYEDIAIKKLLLVKFFILVGMHPEIKSTSGLFSVASLPIDAIPVTLNKLCISEAEVNSWLTECVYMHPHASVFKTIRFVTHQ